MFWLTDLKLDSPHRSSTPGRYTLKDLHPFPNTHTVRSLSALPSQPAQNFHLEKINVKDQSVLLQYSCCTIQYSSEDDSNTPVCTVGYGVERHFQQYFSHIVEVNFIGGGNHRSVASHWQTLSHNVVSSTPRH